VVERLLHMQRSDCLTARRLERQFDDGTRDVLFSPTHSLWIEQDEKKPNRWELFMDNRGNWFVGAAESPQRCAEMLSFGTTSFPWGWIRVFPAR
jgi:hypothetical protein